MNPSGYCYNFGPRNELFTDYTLFPSRKKYFKSFPSAPYAQKNSYQHIMDFWYPFLPVTVVLSDVKFTFWYYETYLGKKFSDIPAQKDQCFAQRGGGIEFTIKTIFCWLVIFQCVHWISFSTKPIRCKRKNKLISV